MRKSLILITSGVSLVLSSIAYAQSPVDVCMAMVTNAVRNVKIKTSSSSFLNIVYDNYCEQDGSVKSSAFNAGLSVIVQNIPVGFSGGG